jgi:phosphatidylglycerophosphate synthase
VVVLFVWDFPNHNYWATAVFAVAMATDWFDGRLARRSGRTSALGSLLEPVADKLLVLTVMILLVGEGVFPGWMVALISPVNCSSRGSASRRSSAEPSSTRATWGASRPGCRRLPQNSGTWLRPAPSTIR